MHFGPGGVSAAMNARHGAPDSVLSVRTASVSGVQGVARAEAQEHVGSGRMNENRLRRLTFNSKSGIRF